MYSIVYMQSWYTLSYAIYSLIHALSIRQLVLQPDLFLFVVSVLPPLSVPLLAVFFAQFFLLLLLGWVKRGGGGGGKPDWASWILFCKVNEHKLCEVLRL